MENTQKLITFSYEEEDGFIYTIITPQPFFTSEPNYPEEEFPLVDVFSKGSNSLFIIPSKKKKFEMNEKNFLINQKSNSSSTLERRKTESPLSMIHSMEDSPKSQEDLRPTHQRVSTPMIEDTKREDNEVEIKMSSSVIENNMLSPRNDLSTKGKLKSLFSLNSKSGGSFGRFFKKKEKKKDKK